MKKIVNLLEKGIITLALGFLLLTGLSLSNTNAFANRKITVHLTNLNFVGSASSILCDPEGSNCEVTIIFEIPD